MEDKLVIFTQCSAMQCSAGKHWSISDAVTGDKGRLSRRALLDRTGSGIGERENTGVMLADHLCYYSRYVSLARTYSKSHHHSPQ